MFQGQCQNLSISQLSHKNHRSKWGARYDSFLQAHEFSLLQPLETVASFQFLIVARLPLQGYHGILNHYGMKHLTTDNRLDAAPFLHAHDNQPNQLHIITIIREELLE